MRILEKINEIEIYLREFESIIPKTLKDYQEIKEKAACERYFEKIMEAVVDLSFLIIKDNNLNKPEDDKGAFDISSNNKIISKQISEKLKDAKSMKNIISHQYGFVDDKIVFESITKEFLEDVHDFLNDIKNNHKEE